MTKNEENKQCFNNLETERKKKNYMDKQWDLEILIMQGFENIQWCYFARQQFKLAMQFIKARFKNGLCGQYPKFSKFLLNSISQIFYADNTLCVWKKLSHPQTFQDREIDINPMYFI